MLFQDSNIENKDTDFELLSDQAAKFLSDLTRVFGQRLLSLLQRRNLRQAFYNVGHFPNFLSETKDIRDGEWSVCDIPKNIIPPYGLRFFHVQYYTVLYYTILR